jgi:hypothetical protein
VTEQEWRTSDNLEAMLESLEDKASSRKLRLFACGCCRHIWHLLTEHRNRQAVELSERYADGMASDREVTELADQMVQVEWDYNQQLAAYYAINPGFDLHYCSGGSKATSPYH